MISEIEIRLRADVARLQEDMTRARKSVGGALDDMNTAVAKNIGKWAGLGVAVGGVAFGTFIKGAIDATDALNDLSDRTQITVTDLAALDYTARLTGSSLDGVAGAVTKLSTNIGKDTAKFRALGITAQDPIEAFKQLADIFKSIQDPQQRAAFGAEALGKSWQEAAPALLQGSEGIAALMERGRQLSGVTDQVAADAGKFNDKLDELGFVIDGTGKRIASALLPSLNMLVDDLTDTSSATKDATAQFKPLADVFGAVVVAGGYVAYGIKEIGREIGAGASQLREFVNAFVPLLNFDSNSIKGFTQGIRSAIGIGDEAAADAAKASAAFDTWKQKWTDLGAAAKPVQDETLKFMEDVDKAIAAGQNAQQVTTFLDAEKAAAARKKAAEEAVAAAKKENEAYRSTLGAIHEKIIADQAELAAGVPLLESQKARIKLDQDLKDGKLVLTATHEKEARAALDAWEAQEKLRKSTEQTRKAIEELNDQRADEFKAAQQEARAAETLVENFGKTKLALDKITLARMEERLAQRAALELDQAEVEQLEKLIEAKKRSVAAGDQLEVLEKQKAATEQATKDQLDMWKAIEETAHDTFVSILDGGKGLAQRLKDSLKNIFFDWLYQQTLKKWVINLSTATSDSAAGGAASGLAQFGSLFGGGGGGSSVGGLLSTGKSIYDAITNGFTGVATSIGGAIAGFGSLVGSGTIGAFGTGMGLSSAQAAAAAAQYNAAGMTGIGSSLTSGSMAGGIASSAAGILAGIYGGRAISGGFSAFGGSGNSSVNTGTAIGTAIGSVILPGIGTALGGLVGGLFGGAVNRIFGRKAPQVESQGLTGMFGPEGFSGSTFQNWVAKGGWFRSTKRGTNTQAVTGEAATALSDSFAGIKAASLAYADALGAPTDQITTYSRTVKLALTSDDTKNQAIFAQLLTDIGNDLAYRIVPNLDKFQMENESASAALARLTGNYVALDAVLKTIGTSFGAVGVGSIEARERLIALSGGLEQLTNNAAGFAQNFLTEAERQKPVMDAVTKGLADMGLGWVDTREEFKQVVLATDKTTEAGAKQFAGLLALQAAFASLYPSTEELTAALQAQQQAQKDAADAAAAAEKELRERMLSGLQTAVSDTLSNLGTLVDAQKDQQKAAFDDLMAGINTGIDTTNKKVAKLRELSSALASFRPAAQTATQMSLSRQVGSAQLTAALAVAKASGVLPSADSLKFALSSLSADISSEFATSEDYQRAQLRAANDIAALNNLAGAQTSIEEETLKTLQDQKAAAQANYDAQIGVLNSLLETAKKQADAATRTADSVATATTLPAALLEFGSALAALVAGRGADLPQSSLTQLGQGGTMGPESVDALLYELQTLNAQMANLKIQMERTAANTAASASSGAQLAQQFDQVSAGGNALLTEATP